MTPTNPSEETKLPMAARLVFCHRLGRELPVADHNECPYCYGTSTEVATGEHAEFCDFRKGVDPISFGLHNDDSRHRRG